MRTKKIITTAIIIAAFATGIWSYKARAAHDDAPAGAPPPPAVSVAAVQEKDVQQYNDFSGRLVAVDQADIRPRVSGTIDSVHFKDGGAVKKGDLLFTIDPRPYAAEVGKADGALASAKAQAVLAQTEYARGQKLIGDKTISQHDFDQRKDANNVAAANVKSAQAALDAAALNLDYTKITAPIDGRVSRAEVTEGNLVEAGGSAPVLTTVISDTPIYADFDMDEASYLQYASAAAGDIGKIPVRMGLTGEQGAAHEGHLESFDNRVNAASGTIRVRALFDNKDGVLVPGLFAHVQLGSPGSQHVLLISDRAVGTDQDKKFVYVVGADNKVVYREVKLAASIGNLRVVTDGLKAGENIIVNGLQRVHPGIEVKPETVPMDDSDVPPADAAAPAKADAPAAATSDKAPADDGKTP